MRTLLRILAVLAATVSAVEAQTIWSGFDVSFAKPDFADPQAQASQDRISDSVWITRDVDQGIFNIQQEPRYVDASPADTEWAFAGINFNPDEVSAANFADLNFADWATSLGAQGALAENILVVPGVVHLISDDIYIDIMFTAWSTRGDGGGFAYQRGGPPATPTPIAGTANDIALSVGQCRNLTSGQRVTLSALADGASWDCSAAGLIADTGESVLTVLRGTAVCDDLCRHTGETLGLDARVVRCANRSSGASVNASLVGADFDCTAGGLAASDGDALQIILFGVAEPQR